MLTGEAAAAKLHGPATTPFLLRRIAELTGGASLAANIALVKNNARVGARLAVDLAARLRKRETAAAASTTTTSAVAKARGADASPAPSMRHVVGRPIVVGGALVDVLCRPAPDIPFTLRTSNPGTARSSFGGVGRNIAEAMARLQAPPLLVTALGSRSHPGGKGAPPGLDSDGAAVCEALAALDVAVATAAATEGSSTSRYVAMLDNAGDLVAAVADTAVLEEALIHGLSDVTLRYQGQTAPLALSQVLPKAPLVVLDGNVPVPALQWLVDRAVGGHTAVMFEATSVHKCRRIVKANALSRIAVLKCNE